MTPRVGSKVWFKPKGFGGSGWQPASIEGWLVLALTLAALVVPLPWLQEDGPTPWLYIADVVVSVGGSLAACYFKGTSSGGRRELIEYHARTAASASTPGESHRPQSDA